MKISSVSKAPIKKQLYDTRINLFSAIMDGKYNEARQCQKEFAKIAVDNFDIAIQTPQPVKGSFPLFSKMGWKAVKFMIFKFFSKKTPEEKQLKKMLREYNEQTKNTVL
ncbi:hypothetical protein IJO12_01275 [bacterium]|nr:hypothetical protein [bacterium]